MIMILWILLRPALYLCFVIVHIYLKTMNIFFICRPQSAIDTYYMKSCNWLVAIFYIFIYLLFFPGSFGSGTILLHSCLFFLTL